MYIKDKHMSIENDAFISTTGKRISWNLGSKFSSGSCQLTHNLDMLNEII